MNIIALSKDIVCVMKCPYPELEFEKDKEKSMQILNILSNKTKGLLRDGIKIHSMKIA